MASALFGGCSTPASLVTCLLPTGCVSLEVAKHVHQKLTEGDPVPCFKLNTVERALNTRCGPYRPGSIDAEDIAHSGLPLCPLALAARDPQLWPALPDLLAGGASPERCAESPLATLARAHACPEFDAATPPAREAIRFLAVADSRAVHHDVMRMLSCPAARTAGLDGVLDQWLADGLLEPGRLAFSPLAALHPTHVASSLSQALEQQGHTARQAFGAYAGQLPGGFEEALRHGHFDALDWWIARAPELVNRVPPSRANQLPWLPLSLVLTPSFIADPQRQRETAAYLLARGADPWARLPHDRSKTVIAHAQALQSPWVEDLDPLLRPPPGPVAAATLPSAR